MSSLRDKLPPSYGEAGLHGGLGGLLCTLGVYAHLLLDRLAYEGKRGGLSGLPQSIELINADNNSH